MDMYQVTWTIDIGADSVEDAVRQVWEILQDPNSQATFFTVRQPDGTEIFKDFHSVVKGGENDR